VLTTPRSENEQILLGRLSVFADSWTLEAAEAVCCDDSIDTSIVRDVLSRLVENGLVTAEEQEGMPRCRFRGEARQAAENALSQTEDAAGLRRRHRDWYVALTEEAEPKLFGPEQVAWTTRLEAEHDNLWAALRWSLAEPDGAEAALRLVAALRAFWFIGGHLSEGRRWIESALDHAVDVPPAALARGLQAATFFAYEQSDLDRAEDFGEARTRAYAEVGRSRESRPASDVARQDAAGGVISGEQRRFSRKVSSCQRKWATERKCARLPRNSLAWRFSGATTTTLLRYILRSLRRRGRTEPSGTSRTRFAISVIARSVLAKMRARRDITWRALRWLGNSTTPGYRSVPGRTGRSRHSAW
jgi:hypothetical protein